MIHSGFKHVRQMLRQHMPLIKRLHAVSMMFSSVLLASIYVLLLLSLPLACLLTSTAMAFHEGGFSGLVTIWAINNTVGAKGSAGGKTRKSAHAAGWVFIRSNVLAFGVVLLCFVGYVRYFGVYGEFNRTPKGRDEHYLSMPLWINTALLAGDVFSFAYSSPRLLGLEQTYFLLPLNVTACGVWHGALLVLARKAELCMGSIDGSGCRILITGATSAIVPFWRLNMPSRGDAFSAWPQ